MPSRKKKPGTSRGASRGHLTNPGTPEKKSRTPSTRPVSNNRKHGFAGGARPYDYAAYEKEEATPAYMRRLFDAHGMTLTEKAHGRFWDYYCLLREHNAALDLTRIMGIEATVLKHFIDCMVVADLIPVEGPLLDIGSGPGFPGAPLAIRCPEVPVILAESRGKRVTFLKMLKEKLKLENVEIHPRSVREDSPLRTRMIVTRAVEVIPATLRRVEGLLEPGGRVAFMKGPNCGQEVTEAQQGFKGVYRMCDDIRYTLPETDQKRRLVVFEKRIPPKAE